jgi:hypothetical protein
VEEMVDRLAEALDPESGLGQVAGHRGYAAVLGAQALDQGVDLAARALAHQHVNGPLAL